MNVRDKAEICRAAHSTGLQPAAKNVLDFVWWGCDFGMQQLVDYLTYRRDRWPDTANPHLLITQQTAVETGPASRGWHKRIMRQLAITLAQLRHDRLLDELRAHGPDPLHFQAVFGCSTSMAIEYAAITR